MTAELTPEQVHRLALEKLGYNADAIRGFYRMAATMPSLLNTVGYEGMRFDANLVAQLEALLVTDEQWEDYLECFPFIPDDAVDGFRFVRTASPLDCARAALKVLESQ